jgi:hypothetical protein
MAVVQRAQKFWADEAQSKINPAGSPPPSPTKAAQDAVTAKINASGVLTQSDLRLATEGVVGNPGALLPPMPNLFPTGAEIEAFIKAHWLPITLGVVGVSLGLTIASKLAHGYVKVMTGGLL